MTCICANSFIVYSEYMSPHVCSLPVLARLQHIFKSVLSLGGTPWALVQEYCLLHLLKKLQKPFWKTIDLFSS